MQPFNFSDSLDAGRSRTTSFANAAFLSPVASVDDTSFAMEVDCSAKGPAQSDKMSVVTPKAPTPLSLPLPAPQVGHLSASCGADTAPLATAAPSASVTANVATVHIPPQLVSSAPLSTLVAPQSVAVAVPEAAVVVPCGVQIAEILDSFQTVLDPLLAFVNNSDSTTSGSAGTSNAKNSPLNGSITTAPSLTSSLSVDVHNHKKSTALSEPAADDEMQKKKLKYLDKILFPSRLSDTKPAELSQNGEVLHIIQQTLRYTHVECTFAYNRTFI